MDFCCSSLRLLKSVVTSVSEVAFFVAAFSACETASDGSGLAATAAAPTTVALRKVRRVIPEQHSQSS